MLFSIIGIGLVCYGIYYAFTLCFVDCDLELAFYEIFGKSVARLKGQVVFITGASSGIGEATAVALAKHGVKLVLAARRRHELERVKRRCLDVAQDGLNDNDILIIAMDMCDLSSHKRNFDYAVRHFGTVDILFNNAGRSQRAIWENTDIVVDKEMFELNVFSVIHLTRIAIEYFNTKGKGHVAVTSSLAGVIDVPFSCSYTGSKHALHGYMGSLRAEKIQKHITVSLYCPGPVHTNFLQESFTEQPGKKYGISTQATDKRMTADRCGQLCAVALANKTTESWMGLFPVMHLAYMAVYFPIFFKYALKIVGPEKLFKLRDSKEVVLTEVETI